MPLVLSSVLQAPLNLLPPNVPVVVLVVAWWRSLDWLQPLCRLPEESMQAHNPCPDCTLVVGEHSCSWHSHRSDGSKLGCSGWAGRSVGVGCV